MRALLAVAAAVCAAACSVRPAERCKVQCGAEGECPENTACAADLYCHASDDTAGLCPAAGEPDASSDLDDAAVVPPDASGLALDQPCEDDPDSCTGDLVCADYGVGGAHCKETCTAPEDCRGARSRCSRTDVDSGEMLCSSNCDPLGTGDCADGEKCLLGRALDDLLDVNCAAHGGKALLDPCSISADCGPGLICVGTAPDKLCRQLCVVGDTSCGAGSSCTAVAGENQLGGVDYSYCQPSA
jgi:hypothetical protein